MLGRVMDWAFERGLLEYGPYAELEITDKAWPLCVALGVASVLAVAYVEHGTVMVP